MSARWLLALDVGGGGVRALLLREDGSARARAFRPFALGAGDLDTRALWRELAAAAREARARAGVAPDDVAGVAATEVRFALVLAAAAGAVRQASSTRST